MEIGGQRNIGRPKLRWSDVIRKCTKEEQVKIEDAQERRTWRLKTRCADRKVGNRPKHIISLILDLDDMFGSFQKGFRR